MVVKGGKKKTKQTIRTQCESNVFSKKPMPSATQLISFCHQSRAFSEMYGAMKVKD
jgi:hypothetical protein